MASIRKVVGKKGVAWEVRVRRAGVTSFKSFKTKAEAEKHAYAIDGGVVSGQYVDSGADKITLGQLAQKYLEEVTPSKKGARQETSRIKCLLQHPIAQRKLSTLRAKDFYALRQEMIDAGYANSTINKPLFLCSAIYKAARKQWGYDGLQNPLSDVDKMWVDPEGDPRVIHLAEKAAILSHLTGVVRDFVDFGMGTGMRRGEISKMEWEDIHFEEENSFVQLVDTKNKKQRQVPLSDEMIALLNSLERDGSRVFDVHPDTITTQFRIACEAAGIEGVVFHTSRHTFTTALLNAKANPQLAQRIIGHSTRHMMNRYFHPTVGEMVEEVNRVNEVLSKKAKGSRTRTEKPEAPSPSVDGRPKLRLVKG
jgi:integrase